MRKRYLGKGLPARIAAEALALRKADLQAMAEAWRQAVAQWDAAKALSGHLLAGANLMASATLLCAGFHRPSQHRWKRRNVRQ